MEQKKTIGAIIEEVVRKKKIRIVDFADQINCVRHNVYDIFKRNSIDIELLAKISKVLNHNFFEDIAQNYDLALPIVDEEAEANSRAVGQFFDAMPRIFEKLNFQGHITMGGYIEHLNTPLPDFVISPYFITVTVGEKYQDRYHKFLEGDGVFDFTDIHDEEGNCVTLINNKVTNTQLIDIKLDFKSEEEWESHLLLAIATANKYYNDKTRADLRKLEV